MRYREPLTIPIRLNQEPVGHPPRSSQTVRGGRDRRRPAAPRRLVARVNLLPDQSSTELFPTAAWSAAWRRAAAAPPRATVPPCGLPELRNAVVRQLLWTMGVPLDGHAVVVTDGAVSGLRLVLEALGFGAGEVALEDPAPPAVRRAIAGDPVPLRVDGDGADLAGLPARCRAIVVAPDGQPPLARAMPVEYRREVVGWARRTGGHVVAIAPPGAPPPRVTPLPSLMAADGNGRVALVGSIGEHLSPALQLGYAAVPAGLLPRLCRLVRERGGAPPYITQLAAAQLLRDGTLLAHARCLARVYAYKRQFVASALAPLGDAVRLGPPETTGATPLYLADGTDAAALAAALSTKGVRVRTLASYHWAGDPVPPGLMIGYGHLPAPALHRALSTLKASLKQLILP
jgi:GntR family transcriptional regulator / MocR family aminotransferase